LRFSHVVAQIFVSGAYDFTLPRGAKASALHEHKVLMPGRGPLISTNAVC